METTRDQGFRHEALLYAGAEDFVVRALPIIESAVSAGDPVLVAIDPLKLDLLRDRLGSASGRVIWKDIRAVGGNPSRIIPVWRQFVSAYGTRGRLLGFGEPVWAGRSPAGLVEAQRHEHLLNLAFAGASGFTLLCPYDTDRLDPAVLREADHSHANHDPAAVPFDAPLSEAPGSARELSLEDTSPAAVRAFLASQAPDLRVDRMEDLAIGIAAVAGAMRPPEGGEVLRIWREPDGMVAEVTGLVRVTDPLAGREWPAPAEGPHRGLWLANQLCDLVELRSFARGSVVRLHVGQGFTGHSSTI